MTEVPFPFEEPEKQKFIQVDDEGYFMLDGARASNHKFGADLLKNMVRDEKNRFFVNSNGVWALVESFDAPYVAQHILKEGPRKWKVQLPYSLELSFNTESLCLDEWDRFHGRCENEIPFVMSRKAQAGFFDLLDEFDDDSITVDGKKITMPPWLVDNNDALDDQFWNEIYQTEPNPAFDLKEPAKALSEVFPQLKLNKSRVAIIGAGKGDDAAFFASQKHIVTAFDISPDGIAEAKNRHPENDNLKYVLMDGLNPDSKYFGQFDLIFEHTCYCAVPPSQRNQLMASWKKLLNDEGHVLGVFFAMDKRFGPPFGGSEWELKQRFEKDFDFLYWTRWKTSLPRRLGKEVVIYMQKK